MRKLHVQLFCYMCTLLFALSACNDDNDPIINNDVSFVVSYDESLESVLRNIPSQYINAARNELHIAYQHTSHGTHVSYGIFGLQDYKDGDETLFAITNNDPTAGKLDFRDNVLADYAPPGVNASDLSVDETAFIQTTRNYLDDPDNAEVNVIMWSWCNIAGHNVFENYLTGMDSLIKEYGPGGIKIGSGQGHRKNQVHFIFMTGHANQNNNVGDGKPKNQADLITDYCALNNQFCLDYYGIDTHEISGKYWEDTGDNGNSDQYGGNFYQDWQDDHSPGIDYYENKRSPGGEVTYGAHNTQHITANRKAYAFWYILARISGWNGNGTD